ncbi:MAG: BatD family protein [Elusimicrobiaceae bacterium]|uniref:BatD family protein n=1 Tax=Candidatus Avelusimicrobium faecicola TaxID=3416205 RepID=UPI002A783737|nr:BatD family protein [Spirochaetota bacterium]MDY2940155.1 BatD family protein [Elusimicrobiaceae bacterium]
MRKLLFFLWCFTATALGAVTLTATVDKTNLSLDDELTLTVEIRGADMNSTPQLPSLPAFNVYSRDVSAININGQQTNTYRYVMLPRFPAKTTIGPVRFLYNGQEYQTQPISVNIYRRMPAGKTAGGSAQTGGIRFVSGANANSGRRASAPDPSLPPALNAVNMQAEERAGKGFFMAAGVSSLSPYVNQPVELIVRFYYAEAFIDQAPYSSPTVNNIFMEPLGAQTEGTQILRGRMYRYVEQKYALSGVSAGKAVIGPAMVKYRLGTNNMFSAFDRLFGGAAVSEEKVVQTDPITLQVRAVPEAGKPGSFYGAVGSGFTLAAQADRTQVEAGEAVNLTITVRGPGNLKPTADLKMPSIRGFKVYDVASNSVAVPTANGTQSVKTFTTVLVPAAAGIYTIDPIEWSYFNPRTRQYVTLRTQPLSIQVSPATRQNTGYNFAGGPSDNNGIERLGTDIRYLKTSPFEPAYTGLATLGKAKFWPVVFLLAPVLCLLGATLGKKSLRAKRPLLTAHAALKKATTEAQISEAVSAFLLQRFKLNTGSLQLREMMQALQKRGADKATLQAFLALWQRLDAARFAPQQLGQNETQALAAQTWALLKQLDWEARA